MDLSIQKSNPTDKIDYNKAGYLYPFHKEIKNASAEPIIKIKRDVPANVKAEIPVLKYNKS